MPVNNLFFIKEKYSFLNKSAKNELRASYTKVPAKNAAFLAEQTFYNDIVIKKMITALEETVNVLEKKVHDLKKEQKK